MTPRGPFERRLGILEARIRAAEAELDAERAKARWITRKIRELNRPTFGDGPAPCPGLACVDVVAPCFQRVEGATVTVTAPGSSTGLAEGEVRVTVYACDGTTLVTDAVVRWKPATGSWSSNVTTGGDGQVLLTGVPADGVSVFSVEVNSPTEGYWIENNFNDGDGELTYAADLVVRVGEFGCTPPVYDWTPYTSGTTEETVATGTTDADGRFCFDPTGYIGETGTITVTGYTAPDGCSATYTPLVAVLACNKYHGAIVFTAAGSQCCEACDGGYFCAPDGLGYTITNARKANVVDGYGNCSVVWSDAAWTDASDPTNWRTATGLEWQCTDSTIIARWRLPIIRCSPVFPSPDACVAGSSYPYTYAGKVINGTFYPTTSAVGTYPWIDADSFTCDPFSAVFTAVWYDRYRNILTGATVDCGPKTSTLTIYAA
jgi:hypothetical protein